MNRHLCFAAIAVLLLAACDENKEKSDKKASRPASARAADAAVRAPDPATFAADATVATGAAFAPTDESAADAGRRYFDGAALTNAGFVAPDGRGAVFAGPGTGNRTRAAELTRGAKARRRALDGTPVPDPADDAVPPSPEALAAGAGKVLAAFDGFQRRVFPDSIADILSRAGWNARKRKGSPIAMTPTRVTVHHTQGKQTMDAAETAAAVRGIQYYHMYGRAKEGKDIWDDIGYHFLIDGAGRVVEGRPAETMGAHARSANENNIGIAMMGDFNKVRPTDAQVRSLTRLVSFLAVRYRQNPSRNGFLEPHRHYDQTDCPGENMMSILSDLRTKIDAETQTIQTKLDGASPGAFVPVTTDV